MNGEQNTVDLDFIKQLEGEPVMVGGHHPMLLTEADAFWVIERGQVELFFVELLEGKPVSQRHHVATLTTNDVMFGCQPATIDGDDGRGLALFAVATMDTHLYKGSLAKMQEQDFDLAMVVWLDRWVSNLEQACGRAFEVRPDAKLLEADPGQQFAAGDWLGVHHLDVAWMQVEKGRLLYQGEESLVLDADSGIFPVTERSYIQVAEEGCTVSVCHTPTALIQNRLWEQLIEYNCYFLKIQLLLLATRADVLNKNFGESRKSGEAVLDDSLRRLGRFFDRKGASGKIAASASMGAVVSICEAVGQKVGYAVPLESLKYGVQDLKLADVLRRAGFMFRKVKLADSEWHKREAGALIAVMREDDRPIALLPQRGKSYRVYDPVAEDEYEFEDGMTAKMYPRGYMIYPPLVSKVENIFDVMKFGMHGLKTDVAIVGLVAVLGGVLGILTPIATSYILSDYIPNRDHAMLYAALAGLFVAMVGNLIFGVVNFIALARVSGRMAVSVQSAIWGRLMRLPVNFFRRFSAGDLANRANGINEIREILTNTTITAFVGVISGLMNFVLMVYYSWRLTIVAVLIVTVMSLITLFMIRKQLPYQREQIQQQGLIDGQVFQLLSGLSKLRVAGRENFGFSHWAKSFAVQKASEYKALAWRAAQATLDSTYSVLSTVILLSFIIYVLLEEEVGAQLDFDLTSFLAFNSAYGQFTAAMLGLTATLATVLEVIPLYERVRPILEAKPEQSAGSLLLDPVRGKVEFARVSFSYSKEIGPVLRDVSFSIEPGEYVAFVGESGAGKSTLGRLLLGFEQPDSGSVFIDGHDLSELDISEYRRQMGVVLQGSQLMSGSILDNIRSGLADLSQEDAEEAVAKAGLAKDIEDMPMGMYTVLPEGGAGLSGGQKQRLMIARALVRRPRVLLFDEATSSLDNISQEVVKKSLGQLNITRIVIAHRLSTIVDVDRIYAMLNGSIVEYGTYNELIKKDGLFARLAKRQVL